MDSTCKSRLSFDFVSAYHPTYCKIRSASLPFPTYSTMSTSTTNSSTITGMRGTCNEHHQQGANCLPSKVFHHFPFVACRYHHSSSAVTFFLFCSFAPLLCCKHQQVTIAFSIQSTGTLRRNHHLRKIHPEGHILLRLMLAIAGTLSHR